MSKMDKECKLLLYLDKRNFLNDMKNQCEMFLMEIEEQQVYKFPPLRYLLEIDVMDLFDMFADIGALLIAEPLQWKRYCDKILLACVQCLRNSLSQYRIESNQVSVNIRLRKLPAFLNDTQSYSGLVCFDGVLIGISKPCNYVYHTVWSCPEECEGNEVILQYIPKVPPKCYVCRSILFENSGLRRCGEQVTATFKCKSDVQLKRFNVVDDIIPQLKLGSRYNVTIVVLKKIVSVWSLQEVLPLRINLPFTSLVPADIQDTFEKTGRISWKFIYCLASTIGINVCPLNCFMHLKISLLISLTSIKASLLTGSSIVHVLAAGHDTGYVGQIMTEAASLAERSHFIGTANTVVSTALIASSGGVSVMSLPLHTYSQNQISSVLSAVESGNIPTEFSTAKLQCAVWAHGMDFKKIVVINVASVFGTVTRGDYGEYHDEVAEYVLQFAIGPQKKSREEIEALSDVVSYINLVAGVQVSLDETTQGILRNYFLAARKESPRRVTVSSMTSLVAITLTSARLCRRSVTNIDDAVLAIWLHVSGSPEPRFAPEEYLETPMDMKKLQKTMSEFKNWLQKFADCEI